MLASKPLGNTPNCQTAVREIGPKGLSTGRYVGIRRARTGAAGAERGPRFYRSIRPQQVFRSVLGGRHGAEIGPRLLSPT